MAMAVPAQRPEKAREFRHLEYLNGSDPSDRDPTDQTDPTDRTRQIGRGFDDGTARESPNAAAWIGKGSLGPVPPTLCGTRPVRWPLQQGRRRGVRGWRGFLHRRGSAPFEFLSGAWPSARRWWRG